MRRHPLSIGITTALVAIVVAIAAACGSSGRDLRQPEANAVSPTRSTSSTSAPLTLPTTAQLKLTSPAFATGGSIPAEYSCTGPSPALAWTGVPADTKELVLIVTDPTANDFVHWAVTGITPADGGVAKGAVPPGGTQLLNSSGRTGWTGPCPPNGSLHDYQFTLLALPQASAIAPNTPIKDAVAQLLTLGTGRSSVLTGSFQTGAPSGTGTAPSGTGTTPRNGGSGTTPGTSR
jgi:Raf kinase inhibitor-like YbhB/YbcL family protein